MMWTSYDTWIVVVGALCAMACALLGSFLVLRRMSMMGDAISHTVLPGIAVAYIITQSRESWPMFLGACIVGVLTVFLIESVHKLSDLDEGASMGVIFTSLFAMGLILIRQAADFVDLDPGCVLYGAVEYAPIDTVELFGRTDIPRAAVVNGIFFLVNLGFIGVFFKELKLLSFDPNFAVSLGLNTRILHYAMMTLMAATVVAAFETVGSILVIAMLIVPGACAYLLTRNLKVLLFLSVIIAILSAVGGHCLAIYTPIWFGIPDTSSASMMGVMAGLLFLTVALFAPGEGVVSRMAHRTLLSLGILRDDILGFLYRCKELDPQGNITPQFGQLKKALNERSFSLWLAITGLRFKGAVVAVGNGLALTEAGAHRAQNLVRSHRLWETYLVEKMGLSPDHVHNTAEQLEHITDKEMRDQLAQVTANQSEDPHHSQIPPEEGK